MVALIAAMRNRLPLLNVLIREGNRWIKPLKLLDFQDSRYPAGAPSVWRLEVRENSEEFGVFVGILANPATFAR